MLQIALHIGTLITQKHDRDGLMFFEIVPQVMDIPIHARNFKVWGITANEFHTRFKCNAVNLTKTILEIAITDNAP